LKLINIGFGSMISARRLVAIIKPESAPVKRMIQEARDRGSLIDATFGRRTRAVLIMDSGHLVLSAIQAETVANRIGERTVETEGEEDE
jgi:extracellular matrix regulatory protein A